MSRFALRRAAWTASVVLVVSAAPSLASAEPLAVRVLAASGLVLDGKTSDEAWAKAVAIPVGAPMAAAGQALTAPDVRVRVTAAEGKLWFGIDVGEDPGFAIGLIGRL